MGKRQEFTPFVGHNPYRVGAGPKPVFVAALAVGDGYFCLEYQMGIGEVVLFSCKQEDFPRRYSKTTEPVASLLAELKATALEKSATLEAIQLLGAMVPLTTEEEKTMATKLARKDELKAAAKETPVAAKRGAKAAAPAARKGNPEALAKAREARAAAGPDTRKITIVNKENPYREGSNRADSFNALKGAKTVADFAEAGGKTKYISRWVEEGRIKVG